MHKSLVALLVLLFPSSTFLLGQMNRASLPDAPQHVLVLTPPSETGAVPETLTREQAEQLAIKNNPRVSVAALLALAQKQVTRETRAGELPSLFGNGAGVGAEEASRLSSDGLTASRLLNHVGAGVQVSQLITDFGHTRNLVSSSSLQAKAAEQSAEATREDIVFAVDVAFYNALEAQATLRVAASTAQERQNVASQIDALTNSKLKSTLDQSFAHVTLSQARLLMLDSQNQENAAMAALSDILGTTSDVHYTLVDDVTMPPPPANSAQALIALALQQRPDLRAQQLVHQADVRFSRAQHEQLLPTISARGTAGVTPVRSTTYFLQDWYGAAGINLSVPIFDGFKFRAEAAEADLRAKASDEKSRQLTDRIVRDVRTAWLNMLTAKERMSVTAELLKEANTSLDLAQTRYQLGLSSIVELSQAQLEQTQAQIQDANARFEYESDLATLRFQSGTRP
ncbi:MAG: TolC family protein [Acidobacteriaceae bacterium]